MFVWKAISSIFLTILATSALDESIAAIACVISAIVIAPVAATERASEASSLAFSAFSAVALIMLDISSSDVLVSSTDAACSLAPEARFQLAIDTCRAAEAVWSAPRSRLTVISLRARFVERMTCHARRNARSEATPRARPIKRTLKSTDFLP